VGAHDALAPLRQNFTDQHYALGRFYSECRSLQHLTSLIAIPTLNAETPLFTDAPTKQNTYEPPSPPMAKEIEEDMITISRSNSVADELFSANQHLENLRLQAQSRETQLHDRIIQLENQLNNVHGQASARIQELENQVSRVQPHISSQDSLIAQLRAEIEMWKQKYESMAKLYANLRKEHIETLAKLKSMQQHTLSLEKSISTVGNQQNFKEENDSLKADLERLRQDNANRTSVKIIQGYQERMY